jgi:hypothetical protein
VPTTEVGDLFLNAALMVFHCPKQGGFDLVLLATWCRANIGQMFIANEGQACTWREALICHNRGPI